MSNKEYVSPQLLIYPLNKEDIITTSGDNDTPWDGNWTKIY
jgi:hypothetical protein